MIVDANMYSRQFSSALSSNSRLQSLCLSNTISQDIVGPDIGLLASAIYSNRGLSHLLLDGNGLTGTQVSSSMFLILLRMNHNIVCR